MLFKATWIIAALIAIGYGEEADNEPIKPKSVRRGRHLFGDYGIAAHNPLLEVLQHQPYYAPYSPVYSNVIELPHFAYHNTAIEKPFYSSNIFHSHLLTPVRRIETAIPVAVSAAIPLAVSAAIPVAVSAAIPVTSVIQHAITSHIPAIPASLPSAFSSASFTQGFPVGHRLVSPVIATSGTIIEPIIQKEISTTAAAVQSLSGSSSSAQSSNLSSENGLLLGSSRLPSTSAISQQSGGVIGSVTSSQLPNLVSGNPTQSSSGTSSSAQSSSSSSGEGVLTGSSYLPSTSAISQQSGGAIDSVSSSQLPNLVTGNPTQSSSGSSSSAQSSSSSSGEGVLTGSSYLPSTSAISQQSGGAIDSVTSSQLLNLPYPSYQVQFSNSLTGAFSSQEVRLGPPRLEQIRLPFNDYGPPKISNQDELPKFRPPVLFREEVSSNTTPKDNNPLSSPTTLNDVDAKDEKHRNVDSKGGESKEDKPKDEESDDEKSNSEQSDDESSDDNKIKDDK